MKNHTQPRVASIKETGEELSQEEWRRFDAAVAELRMQRDAEKAIGRPPQTSGAFTPTTGGGRVSR